MMHRTLAVLALCAAAAPLTAQETRFTETMAPGDRLEIRNINGAVTVTQGSGRTAEVVVTKTVKRGNGNLVKAIMEKENGVVRVCTIFLNRDPNRSTCAGNNSISRRDGDDFEIDMAYEVRVPAGVRLDGNTVNGGITVRNLDTPARISTVNGGITFDGVGAHELQTVNGGIKAAFSRTNWSGTATLHTVNGGITLTLPADASLTLAGTTVNGGVTSDFPITMQGKWGPRKFRGTIGNGGRELEVETVNGGITIRKQ